MDKVISSYTSLDNMKADEYRDWQELPAHERKSAVTLRIKKAFGVRMDTLMRMQSAYDIARTRLREGRIRVGRIPNAPGTYDRAHRQAAALLDKGFQLGGKIRASRDEWHDR
jgi:hypothetical protein